MKQAIFGLNPGPKRVVKKTLASLFYGLNEKSNKPALNAVNHRLALASSFATGSLLPLTVTLVSAAIVLMME